MHLMVKNHVCNCLICVHHCHYQLFVLHHSHFGLVQIPRPHHPHHPHLVPLFHLHYHLDYDFFHHHHCHHHCHHHFHCYYLQSFHYLLHVHHLLHRNYYHLIDCCLAVYYSLNGSLGMTSVTFVSCDYLLDCKRLVICLPILQTASTKRDIFLSTSIITTSRNIWKFFVENIISNITPC